MNMQIQADVSSAISTFKWNEVQLIELLTGRNGAIVADLVRRAVRVEGLAKQIASSPPPSQPGHGPSARTGRLRGSITWRLGVDFLGTYVDVGSAVTYARFLEEGTSKMAARPFLKPALEAARA